MSGHFESHFPESGSVDYSDQSTNIDDAAIAELRELAARYPQPRSALLPMLHLVQSVDGRVSPRGIEACAEILGITTALCAVMGGDALLDSVCDRLGIQEGETTPDGTFSLERIECNAACDFAPVMMINWEFMDNMDPHKANRVLDELAEGREVHSTRGARLTSWKDAERVLAGFPDGRADEGPTAGPASLLGLEIANEHGWSAPAGGQPALGASEWKEGAQ